MCGHVDKDQNKPANLICATKTDNILIDIHLQLVDRIIRLNMDGARDLWVEERAKMPQ